MTQTHTYHISWYRVVLRRLIHTPMLGDFVRLMTADL